MADAKRCDRCGNFYVNDVSYPCINIIDKEIKRQINIIGNPTHETDLCQDCWDSFKQWWDNKEDK